MLCVSLSWGEHIGRVNISALILDLAVNQRFFCYLGNVINMVEFVGKLQVGHVYYIFNKNYF